MAGFPRWEEAVLRGIGAPVTKSNMRFLDAWQRAEGGTASFNPMNTTQPESGASSFNSVGVRNYRNAAQGVAATDQTLLNGHYGSIVQGLRHSVDPAQLAADVGASPWGTSGALIAKVLGSPMPSAQPSVPARIGKLAGSVSPPPTTLPQPNSLASSRALLINMLNQDHPDPVMNLLLKRAGAPQAAPQSPQLPNFTPPNAPAGNAIVSNIVKMLGDSNGLNPKFMSEVEQAVKAAGGTQIRITSGYRSPQHNAAVGGVPNSNHLTGHAMDGEAYVPGRGWMPLGALLVKSASKYGLRSGDQPGFFNGGVDPVHVDDGYNVR